MLENKKKLGLLLILLVIITISIIMVVYNYNIKRVPEIESLIAKQEKIEEEFEIEGYTIDSPNIILDPYDNSPLTALVIFKTEESVSPVVTIKGKDEHTTYTQTFDANTEHYLPILGLYADTDNEIIIEIEGNEKTINIKTEPLPDNFLLPEKVYSDKSKLDNELYFVTPATFGYTSAYDVNGDVRWYLSNSLTWKIDRLENGNFLLGTERIIEAPYYNTGLYEVDMLGKIYVEYKLSGGYHHDYYELDNGDLLVLSDNFEHGTVEDIIVQLDRETGEIVKTIDLKDILKMNDGKSEDWVSYDWFHNNSLWFDEETNSITLSGRHQDAVINIDYTTGELNWIIGDKTNWSEEYHQYFFTPVGNDFEWQWSQHAAMITPEGDVLVLDNGKNKSKNEDEYVSAEDSYTRGVHYKIDTNDMTIEQVWQYGKERGSEFYSSYVSDIDYIAEDHYLVSSGGIVYVDGVIQNSPAGLLDADKMVSDTVEILNNKVIYELVLPINTYRAEKMHLYENYEFKLNGFDTRGTLGETKVDDSGIKFMFTNDIDNEYESRNINITKENDRLVVKGEFVEKDEIKVILSKNFIVKEYEIIVSSKPYTAMCVDIFTDSNEKLNAYKYINDEGLKGTYNIYMELNGKIYNINQKVDFN